eukprot:125011_1
MSYVQTFNLSSCAMDDHLKITEIITYYESSVVAPVTLDFKMEIFIPSTLHSLNSEDRIDNTIATAVTSVTLLNGEITASFSNLDITFGCNERYDPYFAIYTYPINCDQGSDPLCENQQNITELYPRTCDLSQVIPQSETLFVYDEITSIAAHKDTTSRMMIDIRYTHDIECACDTLPEITANLCDTQNDVLSLSDDRILSQRFSTECFVSQALQSIDVMIGWNTTLPASESPLETFTLAIEDNNTSTLIQDSIEIQWSANETLSTDILIFPLAVDDLYIGECGRDLQWKLSCSACDNASFYDVNPFVVSCAASAHMNNRIYQAFVNGTPVDEVYSAFELIADATFICPVSNLPCLPFDECPTESPTNNPTQIPTSVSSNPTPTPSKHPTSVSLTPTSNTQNPSVAGCGDGTIAGMCVNANCIGPETSGWALTATTGWIQFLDVPSDCASNPLYIHEIIVYLLNKYLPNEPFSITLEMKLYVIDTIAASATHIASRAYSNLISSRNRTIDDTMMLSDYYELSFSMDSLLYGDECLTKDCLFYFQLKVLEDDRVDGIEGESGPMLSVCYYQTDAMTFRVDTAAGVDTVSEADSWKLDVVYGTNASCGDRGVTSTIHPQDTADESQDTTDESQDTTDEPQETTDGPMPQNTTNEPQDWLLQFNLWLYVAIGAVIMCTFGLCCAIIWVRKHRNKAMRNNTAMIEVETEAVANVDVMPDDDEDVIHDDDEDVIQDDKEDKGGIGEDNADLIQIWLNATVGLPQYYAIFMDNGYNSLDFISNISTKEELNDIGIKIKGHQTQLMVHIKQLKEAADEKENEDLYDEPSQEKEGKKQTVTITPVVCTTKSPSKQTSDMKQDKLIVTKADSIQAAYVTKSEDENGTTSGLYSV